MNQILRDHYDDKYKEESNRSLSRMVAAKPIPTDRFQACLYYFPKYFRSGKILEVAAGSGITARDLASQGIDFEQYMVTEASKTRLDGLKRELKDKRFVFEELDLETLSFNRLELYDAIITIALIEHLVDPLSAMKRIRLLLKPGGFVYLDTPNIAKYTRRLKLLFGKFPSTASQDEGLQTYLGKPVTLYDEGHLHYFTFRSLSRLLVEHCGFSKVIKLGYHSGNAFLGETLMHKLACYWPKMFSELAIIAYA